MNNILTIKQIDEILANRVKNYKFKLLKEMPQPTSFKDIDKATNRIIEAINSFETINIVGDYDVDGVTSTAIMVSFFADLGVEVNHIIPNRFEHGYGLSPKILDMIEDGLVITVDNGISAYKSAKICKQRGLDLIITDHHTVADELPEAYAIINPKQNGCTFPFKEICGAQVAWYLCANIKKSLAIDYNLMKYFDFLVLAIVADIMPMVSLNQTMVKVGLRILEKSQRPAFIVLRERFELLTITEDDIGFKIAPLINCAGRMEDASIALDFLLAFDTIEANIQLDTLIELNEKRKLEQLDIFKDSKLQVNEDDKVIVVASERWNEGIIGIVASKLCEQYNKPAFVFKLNDNIAKASARSTSQTHLYNLIDSCKDKVIGFGGHKQAAGLSIKIEDLELFKIELNNNIITLPVEPESSDEAIMGEFDISYCDENIFNLIESYRPFGHKNRYPIFRFNNLEILNIVKMGKSKEFTKLVVTNGITSVEVVIFTEFEDINIGEKITFSATISKNEFRNNIKYNLIFKSLL
ncbi:MAG: single-stranded-DNA-specific exonuclease RecJ [Campylobacterota bacterium]|nr:single-stranded-DNA-specific exonuclease RecJ [Campylobacterota bacterium]